MTNPRVVVTAEPENSETPLQSVGPSVTPTDLFFVRNHFDVPQIGETDWRLRIEGCVRHPIDLDWSGLADFPKRRVFATVECAGNGRKFLQPREAGVQWGAGALGHAEWTGIPLKWVLEKAGVKPQAMEVLFEGADRGTEPDHPQPMNFARSLPLAKALHEDTLLATHMNGRRLEPNHGYPLRLFVPGWYGVASVKWLTRIELIDYEYHGYFQHEKYTVKRETAAGIETSIIGPMVVKSEIIHPRSDASIGCGRHRIFGAAWAGEDDVSAVELSFTKGNSWRSATLLGAPAPYSWRLWEYTWEVHEPGEYELLARATTSKEVAQPLKHTALNGGYIVNFSRPIRVRVDASKPMAPTAQDHELLPYAYLNEFAEDNSRLPLDVDMAFSGGEGI
jgi:DMSO/TMAO reductase YedYZ molybdopterin-dependent catalytic subunit